MSNITDAEIYQAAWALLNKHKNDECKAIDFLRKKLLQYSHSKNEAMLAITVRIDNALKELLDLNVKNNRVH